MPGGESANRQVNAEATKPPPEAAILMWQSLVGRRIAYDQMMWQTPALGLTAQAFLLTLALGGQTTSLGRAVSATLSGALAVITLQLMGKHRQHELRDARLLEGIEHEFKFSEFLGLAPHLYEQPEKVAGLGPRKVSERFRRYSSFRLWMRGQVSLLAVAALVLALIVTGHSDLLTFR